MIPNRASVLTVSPAYREYEFSRRGEGPASGADTENPQNRRFPWVDCVYGSGALTVPLGSRVSEAAHVGYAGTALASSRGRAVELRNESIAN